MPSEIKIEQMIKDAKQALESGDIEGACKYLAIDSKLSAQLIKTQKYIKIGEVINGLDARNMDSVITYANLLAGLTTNYVEIISKLAEFYPEYAEQLDAINKITQFKESGGKRWPFDSVPKLKRLQ